MFEIKPSEGMRIYLEEIGRVLSDYEKATIIYNSTHTMKEIWGILIELAEKTIDERAKQQANDVYIMNRNN